MSASTVPNPVPLVFEQIKQRLSQRIGRDWQPGQQLPTVSVLAREMGCGVSNTHRALRALADEGRIVSRPRRGTFVTESFDHQQKTAPQRRMLVAPKKLYMPFGEGRDGMVLRMAGGLIDSLHAYGHHIQRGPAIDHETDLDFTSVDADAIILIQYDPVTVRYRDDQVVTIINTSGDAPRAMSRGFDLVTIDQIQGGVLAGEHLRKLGVTRACYIQLAAPRRQLPGVLDVQRLVGFQQGLGRQIPQEHLLLCGNYCVDLAAKMVPQFLSITPRPQAVFASCDEFAIGFLIGASVHGLEPKRDYQLVGFDGQARGQSLELGPLTTVAVPAEAMGRQAAEFLLSRLEDPDLPPRRIALGCSMFEGNTTTRIGNNT